MTSRGRVIETNHGGETVQRGKKDEECVALNDTALEGHDVTLCGKPRGLTPIHGGKGI